MWQKLNKPIIGLSPMDGVSDHPFRHITKKYGHPDIVYTEFASVEGICHGASKLLKDFIYDEIQRPILAQVFGSTPASFRQTATMLCEMGFDGIDINMGCPAPNVASHGAGAGLIKTPKLAQEIIQATKDGIQDYLSGKKTRDCPDIKEKIWSQVEKKHQQLPESLQIPRQIPVSVKTRVGYDKEVINDWIPNLLEMQPAAIALHGRTLKQRYLGDADWQLIAKAAELVHQTDTLILGNGDITSRQMALEYAQKYDVDGILIGRASFGNPWIFLDSQKNTDNPFAVALEHAQLYENTYAQNPKYHFLPMRKHLGWYIRGIDKAKEIRLKIFQTNTAAQVEQIFKEYQLI